MWHARLNLEFLCDLYILGVKKFLKKKVISLKPTQDQKHLTKRGSHK